MNAVLIATRRSRPSFASRRSAISAGRPASERISRRTARLSPADCPCRHHTGLPGPVTLRKEPLADLADPLDEVGRSHARPQPVVLAQRVLEDREDLAVANLVV